MPDPTRHRLSLLPAAAAACCLGAAVASAQTATGPQGGAAAARKPDGREPAPNAPERAKPVNNNDAVGAGPLFQKSGGSLLRAGLAAPPDPNQARLSQVSYTALPDPEPKTIRKHDLITIVIREDSAFTSKETSDLKRQEDMNAELDAWARLNIGRLELSPSKIGGAGGGAVPQVKMQGSRNFSGDGSVDRSDSLTARITGEVVDVKPNGTLVLQARKQIRTDEEEQQFVLTGTCRAEDVGADNTVLSTQMFDLQLQKNHKGTVREATRRTWVQRLFDIVSPF